MEFHGLSGKIAGGIVRLACDKCVTVVGKLRRRQFDHLQPVLMERIAGDVPNEFGRVPRPGIGNPDMAAGSGRTQSDAPSIDHFFIDDLRMILGGVGHEIGLRITRITGIARDGQKSRGHHRDTEKKDG